MSENKRPDRFAYFMFLAHAAKLRSTCVRMKVGAVAVKDDTVICTGYNGAPRKVEHCTRETCLRLNIPSGTRHELCRGSHAEMNIIAQSARMGISLYDAEIFCTHKPCSICTKLLINAGVRVVYYDIDYPDEFSNSLLKDVKMYFVKLDFDKEKFRLDGKEIFKQDLEKRLKDVKSALDVDAAVNKAIDDSRDLFIL